MTLFILNINQEKQLNRNCGILIALIIIEMRYILECAIKADALSFGFLLKNCCIFILLQNLKLKKFLPTKHEFQRTIRNPRPPISTYLRLASLRPIQKAANVAKC